MFILQYKKEQNEGWGWGRGGREGEWRGMMLGINDQRSAQI
jgi:hypothetical protein